MHQLLVWSKQRGWLSPGEYPAIHREFSVGEFSSPQSIPGSGALLVVDLELKSISCDTAQRSLNLGEVSDVLPEIGDEISFTFKGKNTMVEVYRVDGLRENE